MGINYTQYAIVGVKFDTNSLLVIDSPAVYEEQKRYDTRTGKVIKTEKVLVKEEESHYEFNYKKYDDLWEIESEYSKEKETRVIIIEDGLYIGYPIGEKTFVNYGRADLLNESVSYSDLVDIFEKAKIRFSTMEVSLHFVASVG
jgi:hypothetical protein